MYSKNQRVNKFYFSQQNVTFGLFGQFSHSPTFGAKIQKSQTFRKKAALFDFSGSFALHFSGKNSKRQTFRKKNALFAEIHFPTLRQFSHSSTFGAKIQEVKLFAKNCTFRRNSLSDASAVFSLFHFWCKDSKSQTFRKKNALFAEIHFPTLRQFSHSSTFGAKIQKVKLFAKSYTFQLFAQLSHFSTFRATSQKVLDFAHKMAFFDFSGKKSKSFYLSQKLTSFRAVISLFDFSAVLHFSTFRAVFLLFDVSRKKSNKSNSS